MYALEQGAAERKTHQDLSPLIKDHGKDRDTDNFVYTLVVGNLCEPVQRNLYNFPLHTHEKIFHIMVAMVGLDTVCLVR
jgi:hypothetical protein